MVDKETIKALEKELAQEKELHTKANRLIGQIAEELQMPPGVTILDGIRKLKNDIWHADFIATNRLDELHLLRERQSKLREALLQIIGDSVRRGEKS